MKTATQILQPLTLAPLAPLAPLNVNFGQDYDTSHPEAALALRETTRIATEIAAGWPARWLSLLGKPGVGKTLLARKLAQWARPRQRMPVFWKWSSVLELLANGEWGVLAQLREQPILVLDDMTQPYAWPLSAFDNKTFRALGALLDTRIDKWTVLTDNRIRAEIAEKDARIASRIARHGGEIVEIKTCPDFWAQRRRAMQLA